MYTHCFFILLKVVFTIHLVQIKPQMLISINLVFYHMIFAITNKGMDILYKGIILYQK